MGRPAEVLRLFRTLHRTVDEVFRNDTRALIAARERINADFKNKKGVASEASIDELIKMGEECNKVLREQVLQLELQPKSGRYRLNIRSETHMFENNPFRDDVSEEEYRLANRRGKKKCDDVIGAKMKDK